MLTQDNKEVPWTLHPLEEQNGMIWINGEKRKIYINGEIRTLYFNGRKI
jgi:hypothetical protein